MKILENNEYSSKDSCRAYTSCNLQKRKEKKNKIINIARNVTTQYACKQGVIKQQQQGTFPIQRRVRAIAREMSAEQSRGECISRLLFRRSV